MREVFWRRGSLFPEPVWRAVVLGGVASGLLGVWGLAIGQVLVAVDGLGVAAAIFAGYALLSLDPPAMAAEDRAHTYRRVAVGLSVEHGPLLLLYGFLGFVALSYILIFQRFLGVPTEAFSTQGFFVVAIVAPLRETVLFSGVAWSLLFTFWPGSNTAKWIVATVGSGLLFMGFHGFTYAGASQFAFLDLFLMNAVNSLILWLPTVRGQRPSLIPVWVAHLLWNLDFYYINCVNSSGVAVTGLAARFC